MTNLPFLDHPDTSSFTPQDIPAATLLDMARGLDENASRTAGWDAPAMLYGFGAPAGTEKMALVAIPVLGDGDQLELVQAQAVPANLTALIVRVEGFVSLGDFGGESREVRILSGVSRSGASATIFRDRATGRQIEDLTSSPLSDLLVSKLRGRRSIANIFGR